MIKKNTLSILLSMILVSISHSAKTTSSLENVPGWTAQVVWYQVFVERFRNGDFSNDPTIEDIKGSWPQYSPKNWEITPWTQEWYGKDDYWSDDLKNNFYEAVQFRRYGGDLQGLLDKLDYLEDLGITALYLNPINDSPSLHKYDARNYRHVDRNFGPDPIGDLAIINSEIPEDPGTWQWTSADLLLLKVIRECHTRGMRIILDYSWNHTGKTFWAWQDLLENQANSKYADWYEVTQFDDPETQENEFDYKGWAGVRELPEFKKYNSPAVRHGAFEGNLHPEVRDLIFAVTQRWLDPDGDGDTSDGIDGYRLDVAEMVPIGFWRDYRQFVKSINPEAFILGEIWWDKWPETLMDPAPWLDDCFDAVMNYRWYMPLRSLLTNARPNFTIESYVTHMQNIESGIRPQQLKAMMNLCGSHDSPRVSTSLYNNGQYKAGVSPQHVSNYQTRKPDEITALIQRILLAQQFSYHGAPQIYYGDEVGMWGADDPDNRKPMIWNDLVYDPENSLPTGCMQQNEIVSPDENLKMYYKHLIQMRKQYSSLFCDGSLEYLKADNSQNLLVYSRNLKDQEAIVILNFSAKRIQTDIPVKFDNYQTVLGKKNLISAENAMISLSLPAFSARIYINR
jgi:cyclomaltodextrinase / maltogenic alpha-amylase / neopullulanase